MRQGHKMRNGSKRATKSARRTARKIAGKSRASNLGGPLSGSRMEDVGVRLMRVVARRYPKCERIAFEEASRPRREARPSPEIPAEFYAAAPKASRKPRGYLPPGRPTWLAGRRVLQSIRGQ